MISATVDDCGTFFKGNEITIHLKFNKTKAMAPAIGHLNTKVEVSTIGTSNITLVQKPNCVKVYQNDELITVVVTPIMRVVRALRRHYGKNVILEVI